MISLDHSPEDDNVGKIMETNTGERRGIRRVKGEVNTLYRCWWVLWQQSGLYQYWSLTAEIQSRVTNDENCREIVSSLRVEVDWRYQYLSAEEMRKELPWAGLFSVRDILISRLHAPGIKYPAVTLLQRVQSRETDWEWDMKCNQ